MQRQLLGGRTVPLASSCGHHRANFVCRRRPLPLALRASEKEVAPEQPSTSTSSATDASTAAGGVTTVVEATVVEPGTASETSTSGGQTAEIYEEQFDFPEPPLSTNRSAALQYGALGAVYAAAGGALAVAALQAPQALLSPATAADPWAATLLGCLAATYVRAAGVFAHLKIAADNGELLCMRHQRLAIMTAVYGVVALASQAVGVASVPLVGLQFALAAATAAVVANVARSVWAVQPFICVVADLGDETTGGLSGAMLQAGLDALSTVAGVLLVVVAGMGLYGFGAVLFSAAPALPTLLGAWPGQQPATMGAAAAGLRRLVGAGLLLLAAQAHALLDYAETVRQPPNLATLAGFRRFMTEHLVRTRDPLSKYYLPSPGTYRLLNAAFMAAAALQAFFVVRAPSLGVDVNWDGALWGPMYGTWVVVGLYGLAALASFDWGSAAAVVYRLLAWSGDLVLGFFNAFVWKFQWAERVARK